MPGYLDGSLVLFAVPLGGIVSPCRWRKFVEPATAKNPVEAAQLYVECAFYRCPRSLRDTGVKHISRELYRMAVIEVHAVVLIMAPQTEDHRVAQRSVDFISER